MNHRIAFLALLLATVPYVVPPVPAADGKAPAKYVGDDGRVRSFDAVSKLKPGECWSILYKTAFSGEVRVTLDSLNKRAFLKGAVGDLLIREPDYLTATFINPENKSYLPKYRSPQMMSTGQSFGLSTLSIKPAGSEQINNIDCKHYKLFQTLRSGKESHCGDMWTTKSLVSFQALEDALNYTCGAPTGYGLPVTITLKASYIMPNGMAYGLKGPYAYMLELKRVKLKPEIFEIPKGFKKARNLDEFLFSIDGRLKKEDHEDLYQKRENQK